LKKNIKYFIGDLPFEAIISILPIDLVDSIIWTSTHLSLWCANNKMLSKITYGVHIIAHNCKRTNFATAPMTDSNIKKNKTNFAYFNQLKMIFNI